jgi:hypothetical protein
LWKEQTKIFSPETSSTKSVCTSSTRSQFLLRKKEPLNIIIDTKELNKEHPITIHKEHPITIHEEHPITIHKMSAHRLELLPGKRIILNMIVFARRVGLHSLKYFKLIDESLADKQEHKAKVYTFTVPKFEVVDEKLLD